ncbi:MAG TPA: tRNA (adenosine(37)-N6)-threonylcarbamoyltransferase complex dimerization subunit type 1 TsaB [Acidimicrobiia bacterium]
MLVLAMDTATPRISVAIGRDGHVLGDLSLDGGRRHAEQLVPAIGYLCRELDVDLHQLAFVAVGLGPGLFTGLRVGVTTARMMAQTLRVPMVGVPTLDLIAYPLRHTTRTVVPVVDARRNEVFFACYQPVPGGVQRTTDYEVTTPDGLAGELAALGEDALLAGDGALRYEADLGALDRVEMAGPGAARPCAGALVELATARYEREEFSLPAEVHPLYLRRSDAEIEWDRKGM